MLGFYTGYVFPPKKKTECLLLIALVVAGGDKV